MGSGSPLDYRAEGQMLNPSHIRTCARASLNLANVNAAKTPWKSKFELPKTWKPQEEKAKWYATRTGTLNWLGTGTRPDIAYTVSRFSEANSGPSEDHVELMMHLFRYISGTMSFGIELGGKFTLNDLQLKAYDDASWADDLIRRHSISGHVVFVAGGLVIWKSKKQTFVALSTTEAEFANLTPPAYSL